MRRILLLWLLLAVVQQMSAQKLVIGDRIPELKVKSWVSDVPILNDKIVMVEFFHSSNKGSADRVAQLNKIASTNKGAIVVVVIIKDQDSEARKLLMDGQRHYYVGIEDGNTFAAYGAQYIPYAVISDKKGRVVWLGNPVSLKDSDLKSIVQK